MRYIRVSSHDQNEDRQLIALGKVGVGAKSIYMLLKWNITEDLKHRDQLRWVGLMNQAKHCAEESIMKELIYE